MGPEELSQAAEDGHAGHLSLLWVQVGPMLAGATQAIE